MQRFVIAYVWLCIAGLMSATSAIVQNEMLGVGALAVGIVASFNVGRALYLLFKGIE